MPNVVKPPTPAILDIANAIDQTIGRFLLACRTVDELGTFESEVEAMKLFTLAVRNIEAIVELARIDLVLVPSANVLARAVFEIAVKSAWMITPDDRFDREIRWLAHLQEEERMHDRIAKKVVIFGGAAAVFETRRNSLRNFRTGVQHRLPPGYALLPGNPSVEQMLENIGQRRAYGIYVLLASYVHGSHASTWLYRRDLGTSKEHGEFISPSSWYLALWTSWKSLQVLGAYVLQRLKAEKPGFLEHEGEIETVLDKIAQETT